MNFARIMLVICIIENNSLIYAKSHSLITVIKKYLHLNPFVLA